MLRAPKTHEIDIEKLVHGGQGIGRLENGKRALVWGVLPGEKIVFRETKRRSDYVEGVVAEVLKPSSDRVEPLDELYLSTSPWQIMGYSLENKYKKEILEETMQRGGVDYEHDIILHAPTEQLHYRNKMEYSFFGDDDGLHLALFNRGTHQKQIVTGSSIARPEIDEAANKLVDILSQKNIRAGDLKSVIIRCNEQGECVIALFTRAQDFPKISELENAAKGVVVVYSNPKSPASVRTQDLYKFGDITLSDRLLDKPIGYDVFSFFQGNLSIFRETLQHIKEAVGDLAVIDMYSGVGAIGLSLPKTNLLVESDANNVVWARKNTGTPRTAEVVHTSSEKALEYIDSEHTLVLDPPRAGLHVNLVNKIIEATPPKIVYLSCNPSTQARDINMLQKNYEVNEIIGYNFFPRTPHIESLAILVRK
jgi:23S rRNA (uracil1939-C5)-methyltransferase